MPHDPLQLIARYEELGELIEARLAFLSLQSCQGMTVRQWLARYYRDRDLLDWDRERQWIRRRLPLGYEPD